MKEFMAVWGFVFAGALFLFAALLPAVTGDGMNFTFFVLGIVFLVLGLAMKRASPSVDAPDHDQ